MLHRANVHWSQIWLAVWHQRMLSLPVPIFHAKFYHLTLFYFSAPGAGELFQPESHILFWGVTCQGQKWTKQQVWLLPWCIRLLSTHSHPPSPSPGMHNTLLEFKCTLPPSKNCKRSLKKRWCSAGRAPRARYKCLESCHPSSHQPYPEVPLSKLSKDVSQWTMMGAKLHLSRAVK